MKPICLAFMVSVIFLCSCRNNDDNFPPYTDGYPIYVAFVDEEGNDLSDDAELVLVYEEHHAGSGQDAARKLYRLVSEGNALRCFVNGNECVDGNPDFLIDIDLFVEESIGKRYRFFYFYFKYWMPLDEYMSDELYEFEYRFKIPFIFGDKENTVRILSTPFNFTYKEIEKAFFNETVLADYGKRHFIVTVEK